MNTTTTELTLEIRCVDESSLEFHQTDADSIRKTMQLLANPRLLTRPQLVINWKDGVTTIPCRAIDMVFARISTEDMVLSPLNSPGSPLSITECNDIAEEILSAESSEAAGDPETADPITFHAEIHTLGAWEITLKVVASGNATVHDRRQAFAHFLDPLVIPFRVSAGGVGLINTANITSASLYPAPDALPENALPMALRRGAPRFARKSGRV